MADVIAVLAVRTTEMFQHAIRRAGTVSKQCAQDVIAIVLFADLENLAATREARDFVGDDGLVETRQTLANGVGSVLHQAPHVPRAVFEVYPHYAANAKALGVSGLGDEVVDAPWIEDSVCVHADDLVEVVDAAVVEDERGHLAKQPVRHDGSWSLVSLVELVGCAVC